MKSNTFLNGLTAFVLAMLIALSGTACVITAFSFDMPNWSGFCMWCGAFTLVATVFFSFRRGGLVFMALILLVANNLLRNTTLFNSIAKVVYHITKLYDSGYHWGYLLLGGNDVLHTAPDGGLLVLSCTSSLLVVWALLRKKPVIFAMLGGLIPLFSCCILLDTPPNLMPLWVLMIGLSMVLLTRSTSRLNIQRALRLTAMLLIPVIIFCSVIFVWGPNFPYEETARNLLHEITDLLTPDPSDDTGDTGDGGGGGGGSGNSGGENTGNAGNNLGLYINKHLDLTQVGTLTQTKTKVMVVTTDYKGTIYLRAQAYDTYNGHSWENTTGNTTENGWPNPDSSLNSFLVTITPVKATGYKFFPYYVNEKNWTDQFKNGVLQNPELKHFYSFQVVTTPSNGYNSLTTAQKELYIALPKQTQEAAKQIIAQLTMDDRVYTTADYVAIIKDYVMNSATYDLKTNRMPSNATDFAIWFLEESDTGYCIHFASAATVLLRAAGIPARFVNGYMTTVSNGKVNVTDGQAHAWVEYLDPDRGWTILEATPAAREPEATEPNDPTMPSAPKPTDPQETEPTEPSATDPTETEPTEPSAAKPTDSTESTNPTEPVAPPKEPMDWTGLIITGQILLVVAAIWGQYRLRLWLRKVRFTRGTPNRQAVKRWRYARRFGRMIRNKPPIELYQLTEKAVFSQHCLTEAELSMYDQWITDAQQHFLQKFKPIELILKLILAI